MKKQMILAVMFVSMMALGQSAWAGAGCSSCGAYDNSADLADSAEETSAE